MVEIRQNRLARVHVTLATFFLPVGVMFLVTGALYTAGSKGGYSTQEYEVPLSGPLDADLDRLLALAGRELEERDLDAPTGESKVRKVGTSFQLEWVGSNRDVILKPTGIPTVARLQVKETDFHRTFVQLHKAKGGTPFKIFAVFWATGLLLLFCTGLMLAWQVPSLRKRALYSVTAGATVFVVMVLIG